MADQNILGVPSSIEEEDDNLVSIWGALGAQKKSITEALGAQPPSPAIDFLEATRNENPDKAAENQKVADELGVSREVVDLAPDEARAARQRDLYTQVFNEAPATRQFFENNPNLTVMAQDSIQQLGYLEGLGNGLARGQLSVEQSYQQYLAEEAREQTLDADRSFGEIYSTYFSKDALFYTKGQEVNPAYHLYSIIFGLERWVTSRIFGGAESGFRNRTSEVGRLLEERSKLPMSATAQNFYKELEEAEGFFNTLATIISDPVGLAAFATEVGSESLPQMLAGAATTAATANPAAGIAVTLGSSFTRERYTSAVDFIQDAGVDLTDPAQIDALLLNPELYEQAEKHGFTRAAIITAAEALSLGVAGKSLAKSEIGNLLLQTLVQGSLGSAGEAGAQLATEGEINTTEVIAEGIGQLATTPIEVFGVAGRPLFNRVREKAAQIRAESAIENMDRIVEATQESPFTERAPESAAEHLAASIESGGLSEVFIPASALETAITEGAPASLIEDLGIDAQALADARVFDGDVRVDSIPFAQHILQNPENYQLLRDHIRLQEDGLTNAEAQESSEYNQELNTEALAAFEAQIRSRIDTDAETTQQVSKDKIQSYNSETEQSVRAAEHEVGLYSLFEDAKSAGLTEAQYQSYVTAHTHGVKKRLETKERRRLKRELKRESVEYQAQRESFRQEITESVRREPLYRALGGLGENRLNRRQVVAALGGDKTLIKQLPKNNKRSIVAPDKRKGVDIDVFAEFYGFSSGNVFINSLLNQPSFEGAVEARLDARMQEVNPTLTTTLEQTREALEALHTADSAGAVLNFELNALRKKTGKVQLKRHIVKSRASEALQSYRIQNITPSKLELMQRREARRAYKAFRASDLKTAAAHKLNQLVAYEMTRQAYAVRQEVNKDTRYMAKFLNKGKRFKNLPVEHREAIRQVLANYQFGVASPTAINLQEWIEARYQDGVVMDISPGVLDADGSRNLNHLSLAEWRNVRNAVKEIDAQGRAASKLRRQAENLFLGEVVSQITKGIDANLRANTPRRGKPRTVEQETEVSRMETSLDNFREAIQNQVDHLAAIILNIDSVLRNLDGFKSLGPAYTYIKGGIDKAFTEGYGRVKINGKWVKRIGYMQRLKQESERLVKIMDGLDKKTRNDLGKEIYIKGVSTKLTREQRMGVLFNVGNEGNYKALIDGGPYTEMEVQAIIESAPKHEMDYIQNIWDFLDSFRPEIEAVVLDRQNRRPVMVEATAVETPHGTYRGGYTPLAYDASRGVLKGQEEVDEAVALVLKGGFVASHTADGHTRERVGSGGRPLRLDPNIVVHHLHRLLYDLEMGDAVHDSWKVLHNPAMKQAFTEAGRPEVWEAIDVWLGDTITGELRRNNWYENAFRHIRVGTTVSKLGFNFVTAALQPLGLFQTAVQIGKGNTVMGLFDLINSNPLQTYRYVTNQSGLMRERERSFNKDIQDAQRTLKNGFLKRVTPGNTADVITDSMFYFIAKMQRFVDVVTWLGAHREGLKKFPDDPENAKLHADRMVVRAQGSGNFHERTNFERGTISRNVRNTEMVRLWSIFLNYFAAKINVVYERSKKLRNPIRHPVELIDYAVDMALIFIGEAILAGLIREGLPEEDDENDSWTGRILWESTKNITAGIPVAREVPSLVEGFDSGGSVGSFLSEFARFGSQVSDGELDGQLAKSANNVAGTLFKYPTSQVNRTGDAIWHHSEGYDVEWHEFIFGYRH